MPLDRTLEHVSSMDPEAHGRFSMLCKVGSVSRVLTGEPNLKGEPGTTYKNLLVEVEFPEGGFVTAPYHGAGIDPTTKMLHGLYKTPVEGQEVLVFFIEGNYMSPVAAIDLPYALYTEDLQLEDFYPLERLDSLKDIELGHRTGSVLRFREDGAVEVENWKSDASAVQSSVKMNADGTIVVSHKAGASVNIDVDGNVQIVPASGKKVNVGASSPSKGGARLDDQVKSTSVEDPTFWTTWQSWWTTWKIGYTAALAALQLTGGTPAGVVTFSTTMQTLMAGMPTPPTSLTGKITVASSVVRVE